MNIGFILSAGGSSCFEALELSEVSNDKIHIVTDRQCSGLETARTKGISHELINFTNRAEFSKLAARSFKQNNCSAVILLFSRIVTSDLHQKFLTLNVHPSLLPAFPGFKAIERAAKSKAQYQGATLHKVNDEIDGGEIVAQTIYPVEEHWGIKTLKQLSQIQKTILVSWFLEIYFSSGSHKNKFPTDGKNWFVNPNFKNRAHYDYFARKLLEFYPKSQI